VEHQVAEGVCAFVAPDGRQLGWPEVARAATYGHNLPIGMEPVLHETAFFDPSNLTWSNGAQACEVEIDPATGVTRVLSYIAVDDVGVVINPMVVEGQAHGGIAQGIGQALFEAASYDPETGQLLTGSYMDYAMPRADDLPSFNVETAKGTPCTHNPLGVKGCGEAGAIGSPPAVINAICHALGIKDVPMPATPYTVWKAVQAAR
jgi:carbon-monoxide dehydrogenase large subunit